jgi:hypothetical protein
MLKNCLMAVCLMMTLSGFWIPANVHALQVYIDPKTGKSCDCTKTTTTIPACSFCLSTGSVVAEGYGNTQGANTSIFIAIKPDANSPTFLICRNRGGTIGGGQAFLPFINIVSGAVSNESVDKHGKFSFITGHIVATGIHPEYTPEQCTADPACAQIQQFCPNGGLNGNEGKNWTPIDLTPTKTFAQEFMYYCDKIVNKQCPCDPRKDADTAPVTDAVGPPDRCASNTSSIPGGSNTFTFSWTDKNNDSKVDHLDIVPADKSPLFSCTLQNPQDYFFGASLPYDCVPASGPDLFP